MPGTGTFSLFSHPAEFFVIMKPLLSLDQKADTLANVAYDAYCAERDWKSFNGDPLPQWGDVKPEIKKGWVTSVLAVLKHLNTHCCRCGAEVKDSRGNVSVDVHQSMCSTCGAAYEHGT